MARRCVLVVPFSEHRLGSVCVCVCVCEGVLLTLCGSVRMSPPSTLCEIELEQKYVIEWFVHIVSECSSLNECSPFCV